MTLVDGTTVKARPAFDLLKEYLDESFDLQTTSEVCNVDPQAVQQPRPAARRRTRATRSSPPGMGPNHYFNNDLFGRVHFLVAALTDNIGHFSRQRRQLRRQLPRLALPGDGRSGSLENPFDIEPDLTKPARVKRYYKAESAHYWNYGERPLALAATEIITGQDAHADARRS